MDVFYLGTHQPNWLWDHTLADDGATPLFVSHRRLAPYRRLRRALRPWALDSGGFSELTLYGRWLTTAADYVTAVLRYDREIGQLQWAAPRDMMCEPHLLARTGLTIAEHQTWTVADYVNLTARWADHTDAESPFMPVLQGWTLPDYQRCADLYSEAGVNLTNVPVVGVGSICRRQATGEIRDILTALNERGLWLHGFGVKTDGLRQYRSRLLSADSMAWSYAARRDQPLPGCVGHQNCANCPRYALAWRSRVLSSVEDAAAQLELDFNPTTEEVSAA